MCDCPSCRRDNILNGTLTDKCACCQCELNAQTKFQVMGDKTLSCEKCITKHYITCVSCQKLHKKLESKKATFQGKKNSDVCPRCFSQYYKECCDCHGFFDRHEIMNYKDKPFCRSCFDKSYQQCTHCNTIYPMGNMTHTRMATNRVTFVMEPQSVCDGCWDYHGNIQSYNSKPVMTFHGKEPHFYGIELEMELTNYVRNERGQKAQEILNIFGDDFIIIKEDGSLQTGFEICTQPASLDEQKIRWNKFFDNLPKNITSYGSDRCGLHVHCSRKPLSLLTIAKQVVFVNEDTNKEFIQIIAGRGPNQYSTLAKKNHNHVNMVPITVGRPTQRYEAINLTNKDTIEYRIFKGTLKRESFFKSLEFCDALIQFCNMGNNSIAYCKDQNRFIDYVALRAKDYPHLYAFICAKVLRQETKLTKQFGFNIPIIHPRVVKPKTRFTTDEVPARDPVTPVALPPSPDTDNQI